MSNVSNDFRCVFPAVLGFGPESFEWGIGSSKVAIQALVSLCGIDFGSIGRFY